MVRFCYLIPYNRTAHAQAIENYKSQMLIGREFYRQQMRDLGFGDYTFRYETEADGVTPKIHVVNVPYSDTYLRGSGGYDLYGRSYSAAVAAGVPLGQPNEVWIVIPEAHLMLEDSTIIGGCGLGGGSGSGIGGGTAMVGSDQLIFGSPEDLQDTTEYDGLIIPQLGEYPIIHGTTWLFMGPTISHATGLFIGGVMHELGHAFGVNHDWRNEGGSPPGTTGNLMFNGFRGLRGAMYPELFPTDDTRLSMANALRLSVNPYFETGHVRTSSTLPLLTIHTSGNVTPVNGRIEINFTAADESGLALALLYNGSGDTIDEMALSGTSASATFRTPYYEDDGTSQHYFITLLDIDGNRAVNSIGEMPNMYIRPVNVYNQAPKPCVYVPHQVRIGTRYQINASATVDPDGDSFTTEWDLDNDGVFEVGPLTASSYAPKFPTAGVRIITARLTDEHGAQSVSAPLATRVIPNAPADVNCDDNVNAFDIDPFVIALTDAATYEIAYPDCDINNADCNADGLINAFDIDPFVIALIGG